LIFCAGGVGNGGAVFLAFIAGLGWSERVHSFLVLNYASSFLFVFVFCMSDYFG
jgi:hypothetical protein